MKNISKQKKKECNIIFNILDIMKKLEKKELIEMKEITDEEIKIAEALSFFSEKVEFPLLDVWSWIGKISWKAFPNKEVVHLDRLDFSKEQLELPSWHSRIIDDFFDFNVERWVIKSVLFCHSLQYLDDQWIDKVIDKIKEIWPEYVILVINKNNGILGKTLKFFEKKNWEENGEKYFDSFPWTEFSLIEQKEVTGNFYGKDIADVCHIISRLLLDTIISKIEEQELIEFLTKNWVRNNFSVDQHIFLYKSNIFKNE